MDHYEIMEKIGRGKYSDVYKAIRVATTQEEEKLAVLKILKPSKHAYNSVRMAKVRR